MSESEAAKELFFKGLAHLDAQDFAAAELFFIQTLQLAQGHLPTLNNLAMAQLGQGKIAEAAVTARNILEIDERNLPAYLMLSICQIELKQYEAALKTCETVISIDPAVAEAHCRVGRVLNIAGDHQGQL
jgi:tetratricopeptide (TPR) repeat protein